MAFGLAREAIDATNGTMIVEWLEEVAKVLQPSAAEDKEDIAEAWFSPQGDCPQRIRTLLAQVKQTVEICVFTITDDRLTSAVLEAHGRGVRIRIITDNDKAADLGSDADRFLQAGIDLRVDRTEYHMHHKFAVFDSEVLLNGSYNWTRGAAANNEENFIVTNNRRLVAIFSKYLRNCGNNLSRDRLCSASDDSERLSQFGSFQLPAVVRDLIELLQASELRFQVIDEAGIGGFGVDAA